MSEEADAPAGSPYLRLPEAAAYLRCSPSHFKRHVLQHLDPIRLGAMKLFTRAELDAWAESQRGVPRDGDAAPLPGPSTRTSRTLSPRAKEILRKLRER